MVSYDPAKATRAELQPQIEALIARGLSADAVGRKVWMPCCYDGEDFAPDLAEVAERTQKTPEQVIATHLASPFKVYVLGFMPGLAYIAGLDPSLYLPRRSQPRVRLPRSTVAPRVLERSACSSRSRLSSKRTDFPSERRRAARSWPN